MKFTFRLLAFLILLGCSKTGLKPDPDGSSKSLTKTLNVNLNKDIEDSCLENRMAIDIGSGSTKMLVAQVNFCLKQINNIFESKSVGLKLKEIVERNQNTIPKYMLAKISKVILSWKGEHRDLNIKYFRAIGTEIFRQATNGSEFLDKLSKLIQMKVRLIDQSTESKLGFFAAQGVSPFSQKKVVVWDIGGGSMQLTGLSASGNYIFQKSKVASVSFKNKILKLKTSSKSISPNPLGEPLADRSVILAKKLALQNLNRRLKTDLKSKKILGIGGVHNKSVYRQVTEILRPKVNKLELNLPSKRQVKKRTLNHYTQTDLRKVLRIMATKTDAQIGSDYPETDVTNIALVLGHMEAFAIGRVYVINADLTYGLILL